MKRYYILLMSTLLMLGLCQPILAQDDDYEEVEVATVAKKKTPAKRPTYPMMEVKGCQEKDSRQETYISHDGSQGKGD